MARYDFVTEAWEGHYDRNLKAVLEDSFDIKHTENEGIDCYIDEFRGGNACIYHIPHTQSKGIIILFAGISAAVREEFEKLRSTLHVPLTRGCFKNQEQAKIFGKSVLNKYLVEANNPDHRVSAFMPVASRDY